MSQSKDAYGPPANTDAHHIILVGDSVGYQGGKSAGTLGPILKFSGKSYCLVVASLFEGATDGVVEPKGVKLVHPAPVDCAPGVEPRVIGVFKYWSGRLYETKRKSRHTGQDVVTDWALCQLADGIAIANRLRYAPSGREFQEYSNPISGFYSGNYRFTVVRSAGRGSGIRWAMVCETESFVTHEDGSKTREPSLQNIPEGFPGGMTLKEWKKGGPGMPGDYGACVVDDEKRLLMGMIWGRNDDVNDNYRHIVYFTTIDDILEDIEEKYPELGRPTMQDPTDDPLLSQPQLRTTDIGRSSSPFEHDGHCSDSVSSDAESIFSGNGSQSTQSSVQGLEAHALRERLVVLFSSEATVTEIFMAGLDSGMIGGDGMTSVLRKSLRKMGKGLREASEAAENRECAKRLYRDARFIADAIRRKYDPEYQARRLDINQAGMIEKEESQHILAMLQRRILDRQTAERSRAEAVANEDFNSSEDDQSDPDNNAFLYDKIREVEDFILNSEQMTTLKDSLREFVVQRVTERFARESFARSLSLPQIVDKWCPQWFNVLGEPTVPHRAERIRWRCVCGTRLYDDYFGLSPASSRYLKNMLTRSRPSAGTPQEAIGRQLSTSWAAHVMTWAVSIIATTTGHALARARTRNYDIPMHNQVTAALPPEIQVNDRRRDLLYLLFCVQAGQEGCGRVLHQDLVPALNSDRELFKFFRNSYYAKRKLRSRLTLRGVSAIGNCKIHVDLSSFASVHKHSDACSTEAVSPCPCWPPDDLVTGNEYKYVTGRRPPLPCVMGPNYMLHYFQNPDCLDPRQRSALCYIPMKMYPRLVAEADGMSMRPGWGVYFEEGWHFKTICVVVVVLLLVVSLLFGITWTVVRKDIQGAWGVGSYCAATGALVPAVLVLLAHRSF